MFSSKVNSDGILSLEWVAGAFEAITGYTLEEYKARGGWREFVFPDDMVLDDRDLEKLKSNNQVESEIRTIARDGRVVWVKVYAHPVWDAEKNTLTGIFGAVQDITERKSAEERLQQQTKHAEALAITASHINSDLNLDVVLHTVCEDTAYALEVPAVGLFMLEKPGDTISIVADFGLSITVRERSMDILMEEFPLAPRPHSDGPVIIEDLQAITGNPIIDLYKTADFKSAASVKIKNKKAYIGLLVIFSVGNIRQFTLEEVTLLEGLSNQASQAITNAHLYTFTERQLAKIKSLHMIDNAITSSKDVHLALKVVIEETIKQLGVDAADILLLKQATNTLECASSKGFRLTATKKVVLEYNNENSIPISMDERPTFIPDLETYQGILDSIRDLKAEGFVSYCNIPLHAKGQFIGVLEVFNRSRLAPDLNWFNFLETLAGQAAIAIDSLRSYEEIQETNKKLVLAYDATIEGWTRAMDLRDKETEGHMKRVVELTLQLARNMGITEDQIIHIKRGAMLHDMGKLGIPDRILHKPDTLTDEEWEIMRKHPQYAYDMFSSIEYLRPALDIPYCHHERWDGSGYPRGLKGEEIPLAARIFAVVDVWDALSSDRPYRLAWKRPEIIKYIRLKSGSQFDPQIVSAFFQELGESEGNP